MLGDFKFLSSSESGNVAMIADQIDVRKLAKSLATVLKERISYFRSTTETGSTAEATEFVRLVPLANLLYGIVEARVSAGATFVLREFEDRMNVARALEHFEAWRKWIQEHEVRTTNRDWPGGNEAMWMFAVNWAGLNEKLLEGDRQPA